jgi:hypothetical protein
MLPNKAFAADAKSRAAEKRRSPEQNLFKRNE